MTNQEAIALASASIAAISLCANVVMGVVLYRQNRRNVSKDRVIGTLRSLLQQLEETRFFTVDPEQELWEFGFERLTEVNKACAQAVVALKGSRHVPQAVKSSVAKMAAQVKELRAFQDSWRVFRVNRVEDWRTDQAKWNDIKPAGALLKEAQDTAANCKATLSSYLSKNAA